MNFPGIWGQHASVKMFLELGMANVERHILGLGELAIEKLRSKGYQITSSTRPEERSGNVCFRHPTLAMEEIESRLKAANVFIAVRPGGLRISPSVYNDASDIEALVAALP